MPPRQRRTVKEVSEELYMAWRHIQVLMDMQIRLLDQLYPNRHNPEHADNAQCTYLLLLEQQLEEFKAKMEAEYEVYDDAPP